MSRRLLYVVCACLLILVAADVSPASAALRVTYISAEAVYVDGGKGAGLGAGDTLIVQTGNNAGTRLIVTNLSSHSAACQRIDSTLPVVVGDSVVALHPRAAADEASLTQTNPPKVTRSVTPSWRERRKASNRFRGYVSLQGQWQRDLTASGSSWYQPGFSARFVVENIAGTGATFRFRHLSRWSYRDYSLNGLIDEQEWTNRLTEFALVYAKPDSPLEIGVGRVISPYIRGIGYIDGGYLVAKRGVHYRVGFAAGAEPDATDSSFDPDTRKIGFFISRDAGVYEGHRLSTTVALSASYYRDLVSREFVYLQNTYSYARRFTLYQSVEVDVNRQWRLQASSGRLSFSNFYLTSNVRLTRAIRIDMAVDARKNIRSFNTMNTPDSLFDDTLSQGMNGGVTFLLGANATLGARTGIRRREASEDVLFSSVNLNLRHFIRPGYNVSARLSRSKNEFTTGYAPLLMLRMPLGRRTGVTMGGGGYLYDTLGVKDNNYYLQALADRSLGSRFGVSLGGRRYFGGTLESVELTTELNANF